MKPALILIDCQRDFGAPDSAMAARGHDLTLVTMALEQAQALTAAAREAGVPVIFVRLETNDDLCVAGTSGAQFIGPQPQAREHIVTKSRYSAFARTDLADHLRGLGIDTVVLAGLTTECCVAATAWAAFEEDFQVVIAQDACAAYDHDLHRSTLEALKLSGAGVIGSAIIVAGWK